MNGGAATPIEECSAAGFVAHDFGDGRLHALENGRWGLPGQLGIECGDAIGEHMSGDGGRRQFNTSLYARGGVTQDAMPRAI